MNRKRWRPKEVDEQMISELDRVLGIGKLFCRLLSIRGIRTYEEARSFFRPQWDQLHDPFLMKDMEAAAERLALAVQRKEKILVYGDYDVDGTTAVVLVYAFLASLGADVDYYLPDRYREGYGLSPAGVDHARAKGIGLLLTLDCGIKAVDQVGRAKAAGIDVIICDHHLPGEVLPPAIAVLDPKREDCAYPFKELSGCGVAFKLVQAYAERHLPGAFDAGEWSDLLAVSIASDIVPIIGENRVLAYFGLQRLNGSSRPGLRALIEASQRKRPLKISDLVFGLGPMINAAGRIADAHQAVRLMLAGDPGVAADYARVLNHRNRLRREYDQRTTEEARALWTDQDDHGQRASIVLFQPHWHKGVVGIAASRIADDFHRPTVILTEADGVLVGSARSVFGFDLHQALESCRDLLLNFGGHRHAAGLSLRVSELPAFIDRFEKAAGERMSAEQWEPVIDYDAKIGLEEITPKFWRILRQFAPFGPGNPSPVFVAQGVVDAGSSRILNGGHLRLTVRQGASPVFQGIAFGQADAHRRVAGGQPFDLCFTIAEDQWQGASRLQLVVKDIR